MALGQVGGVRGDAVGHHAHLDVVAVGQAQVLLGRDVAEHGRAEPADHGGADAGGDVVVARRDVGGERPQRVERGLAALLELLVHVDLDLVHRHVAGALDHDLAALLPGDLGELAQRLQLGELRGIVGVGDRARTQAVAQREAHVVLAHEVADLVEALVQEALLVMRQAPLGHDRAAARDDAGLAVGGERHVGQAHAGMDGEVVDALLGLLDQRVAVDLPGELDGIAVALLQRLVDRHRADRHRASCAGSIRGCCGCCGRWRDP